MNALKARIAKGEAPPPSAPPRQEVQLEEIRDALRAKAEAAKREAEDLQSELAEAKAALAAQSATDVHDERELKRLRAQADRLGGTRGRRPEPRPNRPIYLPLGV